MDLADLTFRVKTEQAQQAKRDLDALDTAAEKAEKAVEDLAEASDRAERATKIYGENVRLTKEELAKYAREQERVEASGKKQADTTARVATETARGAAQMAEAASRAQTYARDAQRVAEVSQRLTGALATSAQEARETAAGITQTAEAAARAVGPVGRLVERLGGIRAFVGGVVGGIAGSAAYSAVASVITAPARAVSESLNSIQAYETALVGVGKTTDILGEELDDLGTRFIDLSRRLPNTVVELLNIGEAAGQLGVKGAENILRYSEAVAKLGSTSDLAGSQAAVTLARLLGVSGEADSEVGRLAAVITELGNNSRASEGEIAFLAQQVAQASAVFKLGSTDAVALGAALASSGVRAELAGSSIGRTLRALDSAVREGGRSLDEVLRVTGLGREAFSDLFREDTTAALLAFVRGLGELVERGESAADIIDRIGLGASEEILKVIPQLAVNYETLGRSVELARRQAELQTATDIEAARAADTVAGARARLANTFEAVRLAARNARGPIVDLIDGFNALLSAFVGFRDNDVSPTILATAVALRALTAAAAAFVAVQLAANIGAIVGAVRALSGALSALGLASLLNPIGLIAAALAAIVAVLYSIRDATVTIRGATVELGDIVAVLIDANIQAFSAVVDYLYVVVPLGLQRIGQLLAQTAAIVRNVVGSAVEPVFRRVREVLETIRSLVEGVVNFSVRLLLTLLQTAQDVFRRLIESAKAAANFVADPSLVNLGGLVLAVSNEVNVDDFYDDLKRRFEANNRDFVGEARGLFSTAGRAMAEGLAEGFRTVRGVVDGVLAGVAATDVGRTLTAAPGIVGVGIDVVLRQAQQRAREREAANRAAAEAADASERSAADQAAADAAAAQAAASAEARRRAIEAAIAREQAPLVDLRNRLTLGDREAARISDRADIEGGLRKELGVDTLDGYRQLVDVLVNIRENARDAQRELDAVRQGQSRINQLADDLGSTGAAAFEKLVFEVRNLGDALKLAGDLAQDLARQVFRFAVTEPLAQGIADFIRPGLFAAFSGGSTTAPAAANGAGFRSGVPVPFALGGVIDRPTVFGLAGGNRGLAGEAGPEVVFPTRLANGRLAVEVANPERNRAPDRAPNVYNVNINVTTPNADGFRRSAPQVVRKALRSAGG